MPSKSILCKIRYEHGLEISIIGECCLGQTLLNGQPYVAIGSYRLFNESEHKNCTFSVFLTANNLDIDTGRRSNEEFV